AVANDLSGAYNPLFIWGGVGVGKTHLMHAVGYSVIEKDQDVKLYCCTGEQFTNDIVEGIRNKTTPAVRQKYRKLKALLIDDVQFIAGKEGIQEEFFHTFNALVSSGSQIILTSDKPPSEISKLEERLKSRFEAGLIVDITPPDFELRCAITQIKAKEKGLDLAMDMAQMIAGNLESARKIEGFLVKLFSEARIKNVEITPEFIETQLGKGIETNGQILKKSSPNDVISAVSKHFSLNKKSLLGTSRSRPVARPRQVLMYILRIDLRLPLEEVGRIVGRDHTTVMHAVNKITHMASNDVNIREDIRGIKNML
ncbi:chromosomal replication initiator protein DnaA, partial [Candidatus Woesebacteria bacterium RIFCSPLOWO2_01_FULL_39_14]